MDMWTRISLSILCFVSVMYPSQAWQKVWTGGQVMKILKKRFQSHLFYCLNVWTCEQVSVFLFHVFFLFRILHNFDKKCGQVDKQWKFRKKSFNLLFSCLKVWTCRQEADFLFYFFFLPCTLWFFCQKCGQVDK